MNAEIYRIIDANANRAREALRTLEDFARFASNDVRLTEALKQIRHDLATACAPLIHNAILFRDTPADVGTAISTPTELRRAGLTDVVVAAGKRLGEALRSIEEYAKILNPGVAGAVEAVRYRFYHLEQQVARALPAFRQRFARVRVCVLVTESLCRLPWLQVVRASIDAGADCIQLREKDLESGELLRRAEAVVKLCRSANVISIINDRPDIAVLSGADGVHVGQTDPPASRVRRVVGVDRIVGVSTHNLEQAQQAIRDGADYIGVGPVYPSSTKPRDILPGLAYARDAARLPIATVAISGITLDNASAVYESGVTGIAVSSAVLASEDPGGVVRELKATGASPATDGPG